eukprot:NODE_174_length_15906_cov_0.510533.p2 type:complete len:346 gc:universal NODE_174_length_15906_cov_0.510533:15689-14652(-)
MGKYYHGEDESEPEDEVYRSNGFIYLKKPDAAFFCCKCEHSVDIPYVVDWKLYCSSCKPSNSVVDVNLANQIGDLEVYCPNWSKGCLRLLKRKELTDHLNSCEHSTFKCVRSIIGCTFSGTKLQAHVCSVSSEEVIDNLFKLVAEQQKDIKSLKSQLKSNDGYFRDFNDDITGIQFTIQELKAILKSEIEFLLEVAKDHIVLNKYITRIDLSGDEIDLSICSWMDKSLITTLFIMKHYNFSRLRFPLNTQTTGTLVHLIDLCNCRGANLKVLTFIGDKNKTALTLPNEFISFLSTSPVAKLRFEGLAATYFDSHLKEILKKNSSVTIELLNCQYDITSERLKISQ